MTFIGGKFTAVPGEPGDDGELVDWWFYEDLRRPLTRLDTAVGFDRDEITLEGHHLRRDAPGSYQREAERLDDMDVNCIEASLCFPTFPRFCGQTFTEATDQELALLCVAGLQRLDGRRVVRRVRRPADPAHHHPAVGPRRSPPPRCAATPATGVHAVCFSEIPPYLGLPVDPRRGRPLGCRSSPPATRPARSRSTCTSASSSKMPSTSPDAPPAVGSTLTFANCCFAWSTG